jgi:hypothetical protein
MPWDKKSFELLRAEVDASLRGRHPAGDVPFFVYLYEPREELRCLQQFSAAAKAIEGAGFRTQVIHLGQVLAQVLKGTLYMKEQGKRFEARDRAGVRRELARADALPSWLTNALLDGLDGAHEGLRGGSQESCAFLLRAGALFPLVHVSQLLNGLENKTGWTVVVPFPGRRNPAQPEALRFLDETEGTYYRARVIG